MPHADFKVWLLHMSNVMHLCNWLCLSINLVSWLFILCGKSYKSGHYAQYILSNPFMSAMLVGCIGIYHFMLILLARILTQKQKQKAKPRGLIFIAVSADQV